MPGSPGGDLEETVDLLCVSNALRSPVRSPRTNYAQTYAREEPTPAHSCSLQHLVSFEFVQKLAFSRTLLSGGEGLHNLHPRFKSDGASIVSQRL